MLDSTIKVVEPVGILDGTKAGQLRAQVNETMGNGADIILIDLSGITFMDSSGLGGLVSALKDVRLAGGRLCVCSLNDQVRILFELTSMDKVFEIYENRTLFERTAFRH
ncbi:MAG: STAS domain-containing protein [Leptolyngbyaceae cyanobacterium SL_7_1]|nr:STAS domain-containing protein [Leptolyngbyaceae cyanobacterium SL_7_1]